MVDFLAVARAIRSIQRTRRALRRAVRRAADAHRRDIDDSSSSSSGSSNSDSDSSDRDDDEHVGGDERRSVHPTFVPGEISAASHPASTRTTACVHLMQAESRSHSALPASLTRAFITDVGISSAAGSVADLLVPTARAIVRVASARVELVRLLRRPQGAKLRVVTCVSVAAPSIEAMSARLPTSLSIVSSAARTPNADRLPGDASQFSCGKTPDTCSFASSEAAAAAAVLPVSNVASSDAQCVAPGSATSATRLVVGSSRQQPVVGRAGSPVSSSAAAAVHSSLSTQNAHKSGGTDDRDDPHNEPDDRAADQTDVAAAGLRDRDHQTTAENPLSTSVRSGRSTRSSMAGALRPVHDAVRLSRQGGWMALDQPLSGVTLLTVLELVGNAECVSPLSTARRCFAQVAVAVCQCHAAGVAHNGILLESVFVQRLEMDGLPQLILSGFFNCRLVLPASTTQSGSTITSMATSVELVHVPIAFAAAAAPEQVRGELCDPMAVDMWQLGVLLYLLCTNNWPFGTSDWSRPQLHECILRASPRYTLRDQNGGYTAMPSSLRDLLSNLLHPIPSRRPNISQVLQHVFLSDRCDHQPLPLSSSPSLTPAHTKSLPTAAFPLVVLTQLHDMMSRSTLY